MAGDEMTAKQSFITRVRPDTAIWLGAAVFLAVISAVLTIWITGVDRVPAQSGIELGFDLDANATQAAVHPPTVAMTSLGNTLRIAFLAIDRHHVADLSVGPLLDGRERNVTCMVEPMDAGAPNALPQTVTPETRPASQNERSDTEASDAHHPVMVQIEIAKLPVLEPTLDETSVVCEMPSPLVHDTYTSRSLVVVQRGVAQQDPFAFLSGKSAGANAFDPKSITLDDADADEIHVTDVNSGETRIASTFNLPPDLVQARGAKIKYRWESITAAQQRDIVIVIIGSLIALAAAALIEALRPYVDRLVHERDSIEEEADEARD